MTRWPKDDVASQIAFYGVPGPDVERQLIPVVPPFQMFYDGKPIRSIRFHKKAAPALSAALNEIWEHYGRDQKRIDALGISKYAGAYNPRPVRGYTEQKDPRKTRWSNHAFGAAIDLNAEENGFGKGHGSIPQPVIDAFKRQGARWGGDYRGRTDPMHFEFVDATGYPGPSIAKAVALMDAPQVDSDSDAPTELADAAPYSDATDISAQSKPTFLRKMRNWIVGGASSLGFGGLAYMSDWKIAAIFFAFIFGSVATIVAFVILFFGADKVRAWVSRQVN